MFTTCSSKELSNTLNLFNVPMFAAQRESGGDPFRFITINRAHEEAAGLRAGDVEGACLPEILPQAEAEAVAARYAACARSGCNQRYIEPLTLPTGLSLWDTSLQHVALQTGGDRIIGTSFRVAATPSTAAFDDILYLTSLADMQLQNVVHFLENADISDDGNKQVARLAALCRGVRQTVADARKIAARPDRRRAGQEKDRDRHQSAALPDTCPRTIRTLHELLTD